MVGWWVGSAPAGAPRGTAVPHRTRRLGPRGRRRFRRAPGCRRRRPGRPHRRLPRAAPVPGRRPPHVPKYALPDDVFPGRGRGSAGAGHLRRSCSTRMPGATATTSSSTRCRSAERGEAVEDRAEPSDVPLRPADLVEPGLVEQPGPGPVRVRPQRLAERHARPPRSPSPRPAPARRRPRGTVRRSTSSSRTARGVDQPAGGVEVGPHPVGVDDQAGRPAGWSGAAGSRWRSTRPAARPAPPTSARCRARARAGCPRAPARTCARTIRARPADPLGQDRVLLVRHRRWSPSGPCRTAPTARAPRCAARAGPPARPPRRPSPDRPARDDPLADPVPQHHLGRDVAGREPERGRRRAASTDGSMLEYVPTAPEIFATATAARAPGAAGRGERAIAEGEVGDAVAEDVGLGVDAVGAADPQRVPVRQRRARAARRRARPPWPSRMSVASTSCSASAVSSRSDEVIPKWTYAAASRGVVLSAQAVRNAMTSCWVTASIVGDGLRASAAARREPARRRRPGRRRRRRAPPAPASPPGTTARTCGPRSRPGRSRAGCTARSPGHPSSPRPRVRCRRAGRPAAGRRRGRFVATRRTV